MPGRYTHEGDKGSDESSSDSEDETKRREAAKGKWKGKVIDGKGGGGRQILQINEKRMDNSVFNISPASNAAHFPLACFTQNIGHRTEGAYLRRSKYLRNKGGKGGEKGK